MPELGVGTAALGRPGYINLGHDADYGSGRGVADLRARTHEVLDAAWLAGIRHVDAARSYGRAEEFVGSWLRSHPGRRETLTLGSKWGYTYVADWQVDVATHEVKDHSPATLERQWPETLATLRTRPDLYLVHSVTPDSPALTDRHLYSQLRQIAAAGTRVGISTSGPGQREVIETALGQGEATPWSAVQVTWNVLETSSAPALRAAYDAGWHVAVKETVANGRLTARGDPPRELAEIATHHGVCPDAIAVAAALQLPADVVLLGVTTVAQLDSNLQARSIELSSAELAALQSLAEPAERYWSTRSALPWI